MYSPGRRFLLLLPTAFCVAAFFIAPLALVVYYSFGTSNLVAFDVSHGWTLANYGDVFSSSYIAPLLRSLAVACTSAAICLLISLPVAYLISLQGRTIQRVLLLAILIPFWTSFVVRTYAWINVLDDDGPVAHLMRGLGIMDGDLNLVFTPGAIVIGMVAVYLPLMILPLYVAFERIDAALPEAARDLGANAPRAFLRVMLPLAKPGIMAGCIMVGIPAAGEYVVPVILGGGKTLLFGNVVADEFTKTGDLAFGSAIATLFMAGMMVTLLTIRMLADSEESWT